MKRIRIAIALVIPAAFMAISVGAHAASSDQAADVAVVLPASFCGSFDELLSTAGLVEPDAEPSSKNIEIFAPPLLDPVAPWRLLDPITVSLFTCDGGGASTLSQDSVCELLVEILTKYDIQWRGRSARCGDAVVNLEMIGLR